MNNGVGRLKLDKDDNTMTGCFALFFGIILMLIVAVVGTAIYLALKNWG